MNTELALSLISIIGEERILRAYSLTKNQKISFAALKNFLQRESLFILLKSRQYKSVAAIAKQYKISKMSVYRMIHLIRQAAKRK
ncbi:MAG TPA: hypothetical protein VF411_07210 [Bacteroidia bacterium]